MSADFAVLTLPDPVVLVLAEGETQAAVNNARGHLFELFVAQLLHAYGYGKPTRERLNITSDGVELDVIAVHELTGHTALAECKAYASPVPASMLGNFHSKVVTRRFRDAGTQGFFVALPRLTPNGQEQANEIAAHDDNFHTLTARGVVELLRSRQVVVDCPIPGLLASDPAVLVSKQGVYAACLELDAHTRTPVRALAWAAQGPVARPVLEALEREPYAQSAPVEDAREAVPGTTEVADPPPVIVTVTGSQSDFEYQLPASPKYFVGRKRLVASLGEAIDGRAGVLVLNAQSGWGKSSAALRLNGLATDRGGHALVVDSRTANYRRFVTDALSRAANEAAAAGVLELPSDASWASLPSALRTLRDSAWGGGPLVVFFDQFENVFRDEPLTREFRDLALAVRGLSDHLLVGFAWKTDLVGWTESHPYQLRDEIRAHATVLAIGPFGAREVDTLIRRLEQELGESLARDLKTRLREYSQGLPWLFKKLASHVLREIRHGATQEHLASEALNVQNLFDADLAELGPLEQEALRHIARYAPIPIGEVMERMSGPVVESLLNRRLVVQVGERLDTYWDIFRDYLNDGRIPVEDSYILRQSPISVARLLREVVAKDGDASVPDIAERLGTSENVVFNLSRELRLLGATSYEPNRVRLLPELWNAADREHELRRRVSVSLRRHRAYSTFVALAERSGGISVQSYAHELPGAFPAVEVKDSTWVGYARVYLQWFEYAGLAVQKGPLWSVAPDGAPGVSDLLGARIMRRLKGGFPHDAPGPSIKLLLQVADDDTEIASHDSRAAKPLLVLGAISEGPAGKYHLRQRNLVVDGAVVPQVLLTLMSSVPGVPEGLGVIEADPAARPETVGTAVRQAVDADWAPGTTHGIGKHLRAWARVAGLSVRTPAKIQRD